MMMMMVRVIIMMMITMMMMVMTMMMTMTTTTTMMMMMMTTTKTTTTTATIIIIIIMMLMMMMIMIAFKYQSTEFISQYRPIYTTDMPISVYKIGWESSKQKRRGEWGRTVMITLSQRPQAVQDSFARFSDVPL